MIAAFIVTTPLSYGNNPFGVTFCFIKGIILKQEYFNEQHSVLSPQENT